MIHYIGIQNQEADIADAPAIYSPAWEGIEKYVGGVFWDEAERGPIPEPETPAGHIYKRMIKLEGEGAPLIFYTYEPLPEPEETQLEKAKARIATLEAADLDNKEMIATLYELTMGGAV